MQDLKQQGKFKVPQEVIEGARKIFDSQRVDNETTVETIKQVYGKTSDKYVIDPHTAVGVNTSYTFIKQDNEPVEYISLSTAHPAKFSEVVNKALSSFDGYSFEKDVLPAELKALSTKEKRIKLIDEASVPKVKQAISDILQF